MFKVRAVFNVRAAFNVRSACACFVLIAFAAASPAIAQCQQGWSPLASGVNGPVYGLATWDHDNSPGTPDWLAVGGSFTSAGGVPASGIALFDGAQWRPLAAGVAGTVYAITSHDPDGPGPETPYLVVGGSFAPMPEQPSRNVAFWRNGAWQTFNTGLTLTVNVLRSLDPDGSGSSGISLYAGTAYQPGSSTLLRWNVSSWQGEGSFGPVFDITLFALPLDAEPTICVLYGATSQGSASTSVVYRVGNNWIGLHSADDRRVMTPIDVDGAGSDVTRILLGGYRTSDGLSQGVSWATTPGGGPFWESRPNQAVYALTSYDPDGPLGNARAQAVAAGFFTRIDFVLQLSTGPSVTVNRIATWDGNDWYPFAGPAGVGMNNSIFALCVWDRDGDGPEAPSLVAGGEFTLAGGLAASRVAAWNPCAAPPPQPCAGDANFDRIVNFSDIVTSLSNWGLGCP